MRDGHSVPNESCRDAQSIFCHVLHVTKSLGDQVRVLSVEILKSATNSLGLYRGLQHGTRADIPGFNRESSPKCSSTCIHHHDHSGLVLVVLDREIHLNGGSCIYVDARKVVEGKHRLRVSHLHDDCRMNVTIGTSGGRDCSARGRKSAAGSFEVGAGANDWRKAVRTLRAVPKGGPSVSP